MVYRRALRYYRPFALQTIAGLLLTLVSIALNLLGPWPFKLIVDDLIPNHAIRPGWWSGILGNGNRALVILCLAVVAIRVVCALIGLLSNILFVRIGLQALLKLRTELYAYLQSLSLKYHDAQRSGDSSFRVAYDSQAIQTMYNQGFTNIFGSVITLIGTFLIMIRIDWQLTLLALCVVPLVVGAIYFFAKRIRSQSTVIRERDSELYAQTQEVLSSVRMVHAFGREDWEVKQFRTQATESLRANLRLTLTNMSSALVLSTLMIIGTASMYYLGTLHVLAGTLTLGSLLVFTAYLLMLYQPLESLTYTTWAMEGAAAGAQRCFEVLDRADDVTDLPGAIAITSTKGAIAFEGVDFGYSSERQILRGIDLQIAPNQIIGLVGGTGAGKSTLLSLVPRFYDPARGRVTLDGRDLKEITRKSLRAQIGIVLQDTLLFSTTIRENIAYSRPDATDAEICDAARRAQAEEFILALPRGYESPVGERGGHLSVGQRQRIGIARAFLKNAPILLLDEPTSALDPTTEAAIMETIKDLMRGRTTLIVTHRLATIHNVDRIIVLEKGAVVEEGSGAELLARGGSYATLYAAGNYPR